MKAKLTKPPMGWNSWDCYGASVTEEEEVRRNAEYMAKNLKGVRLDQEVCGLLTYNGLEAEREKCGLQQRCTAYNGRVFTSYACGKSFPVGRGWKGL